MYGYVPEPLPLLIRGNMPDAEKVTRINRSWSNLKVEDNLFAGELAYADAELFERLSRPGVAATGR